MAISDSIPVKAWTSAENCENGILSYDQEDTFIELESGRIFQGRESSGVVVEPQGAISLSSIGLSSIGPIESKILVSLKPNLVVLQPYAARGGQLIEDVFPHSTSGFYGRLQAGKADAIYFVHEIKNDSRFFLSIVDTNTNRIFETQVIQPYEAEALSLVEDRLVISRLYTKSVTKRQMPRRDVLSILDTPAPSWRELARILRDVSFSDFKVRTNMRDTLSQVVPDSFPDEIRDELMAFLAYVIRAEIPSEDPLAYAFKFSSTSIMESLMNGHLMYLLDRTEWPPYVKLMAQSARGQLGALKRAVPNSVLNSPWFLYEQKCIELLPSWLHIAIDSAKSLNKTGRVVIGLPTSRTEAKRSKKAWKRRYAELSYSFRLRGQIDPASLGLVELIYLGAAYRWSHRHMKFISRLGSVGDNPPHIQVMLTPPSAAERLKRALPTIMSVDWSARTLNLDSFDSESGQWIIPIEGIVTSVERKSSIRRLQNQFGRKKIPEIVTVSSEEARVADLVAEGIESFYLEIPEFLDSLGLTKKKIHTVLSSFVNRNVMELSYEVSDNRLVSLAVIIQGTREVVASVTHELLNSTPTAYARLCNNGESGVILSRVPDESVYSIASDLMSHGLECDVNIRCMKPVTYRRYTSSLYQRLLRDDGTWDDDVSAFLSQARSKRRELTKSNA